MFTDSYFGDEKSRLLRVPRIDLGKVNIGKVNPLEFNSLELNNPLKPRDDCDYPKDAGYCYASKKRFYFNGDTCEVFTYRGCGGNRNNFKTKEECTRKCGDKLDIGSKQHFF